ncbi:MAG: biotin--[acetyl-CoA-carboxylase] ligase [Bacteroidota bacterium]
MGELSQIIKLDATDSTNLYLKDLMLSSTPKDYTVVVTRKQLKGRGQMGTLWESEPGKNLTFSVLKYFDALESNNQFSLNMMVSLAIHTVLTELNVPKVKIKWPNDIMSGSSKICGILIENVLNGSLVRKSIIGIGLNVNQTSFGTLQKASSLAQITGRTFDLDHVLECLLNKMKSFLEGLQEYDLTTLQSQYESLLFRKDMVSTFKTDSGKLFPAIVRGVSSSGQLVLELEDESLSHFSLKEISLQY